MAVDQKSGELSLNEVTAQVDWSRVTQKRGLGAFVTGHQFPGEGVLEKFEADCRVILAALAKSAQEKRLGFKTYSCLAQGTDQVFAQVSLDLGIPLVGIIPCAAYKRTMPKGGPREAYLAMRKVGKDSGGMTLIKPCRFRRASGKAFQHASEIGIRKSQVVITLWNGQAAQSLGATGDAVRYAMSLGKCVLWFDVARLAWFPVSTNEWLNSIR